MKQHHTSAVEQYQRLPAKLDSVPLFNWLPERDLAILAGHATIKRLPRNAVVVNEGDETDSLYVILSGRPNYRMPPPRLVW